MVTLASYQANHLIRNCCLLHVLWDQRQCDVAGHTDEQASTRERSRCDVRAHRDVCGESTPGSHHHHQHQETSSQSHNVTYLTMPNTNTPIITCLCYSVRRDMLDPQTSLDPIFFPIPSFMAKMAWIHKYPHCHGELESELVVGLNHCLKARHLSKTTVSTSADIFT